MKVKHPKNANDFTKQLEHLRSNLAPVIAKVRSHRHFKSMAAISALLVLFLIQRVSKSSSSSSSSSYGAVEVGLIENRGTTTLKKNIDSKTATVMGMATNYLVPVYKRFVGSLRNSGFQGHIILAISPVPEPGVEEYLTQKGVTIKRLQLVNCTTDIFKGETNKETEKNLHKIEMMTCAHPYPELKARWGRFGLLHDFLKECTECTGPVLVTDVKDTFFQRDPFGPDAPYVDGLQLFEEHRTMKTTNWIVKVPVEKCKKFDIFDEPMLCSGTTIGTRETMLQYLSAMVAEMRIWMKDEDCCCNQMNGDDQSIHNYLYYTGLLSKATNGNVKTFQNRMGIVNTVGTIGSTIHTLNRERYKKEAGMEQGQAARRAFYNSHPDQGDWLGMEYDLTDEKGYFINFDGTRSFAVHQFNRFGSQLDNWLRDHSGLLDE